MLSESTRARCLLGDLIKFPLVFGASLVAAAIVLRSAGMLPLQTYFIWQGEGLSVAEGVFVSVKAILIFVILVSWSAPTFFYARPLRGVREGKKGSLQKRVLRRVLAGSLFFFALGLGTVSGGLLAKSLTATTLLGFGLVIGSTSLLWEAGRAAGALSPPEGQERALIEDKEVFGAWMALRGAKILCWTGFVFYVLLDMMSPHVSMHAPFFSDWLGLDAVESWGLLAWGCFFMGLMLFPLTCAFSYLEAGEPLPKFAPHVRG